MSVQYDLYLKSVFDLAATIVIKSEYMIDSVNKVVSMYGYPVEVDPRTWRYYMNLAGEYHAADTPMTVVSTDTMETIAFTKENLTRHDQTRRDYQYGTRYYEELVSRYPTQEFLIRGILNPSDIDVAISAPDHTILYYDRELVESQEINLIESLQRRVDWFHLRWGVPGYEKADPYFGMVLYGQLIGFLIPMILNIRLGNCKTTKAHSFDIRQYLKGNGRLDRYYDYMTHAQRMYFYRNIKYINHNNGKRYMFEELTDRVMTDRTFPLANYMLQTNTEEILEDLSGNVEFRRTSLNRIPSATGHDIKDIPEILAMEAPMAIANLDYEEEEMRHIPRVMATSLSSTVPTKVLESDVMDVSESSPNTLAEVMLAHWPYLANLGLYRPVVKIDHPLGGEPMILGVKDAYVLWMYCVARMSGVTMIEIPVTNSWMVRRLHLPTYNELRTLDPENLVSDEFINRTIADNVSIRDGFISVESFKMAMIAIQRRIQRHKDSWCAESDLFARGVAETLALRCYKDVPVDMYPGVRYEEWFLERGLEVSDLTATEYANMSNDILRAVTGADISSVYSMRDVHEAMVDIMRQLLSYSVQIIQSINTGMIRNVGVQPIRHSPRYGTQSDYTTIRLRGPYMRGLDLYMRNALTDRSITWPVRLLDFLHGFSHEEHICVPMGVVTMDSNFNRHQQIAVKCGMRVVDPNVIDLTGLGHTVLDGYSSVGDLPISDLFVTTETGSYGPLLLPPTMLVDIPNTSLLGFDKPTRSLLDALVIDDLDGFNVNPDSSKRSLLGDLLHKGLDGFNQGPGVISKNLVDDISIKDLDGFE